jgi:hypothetical protein
MPTHILGNGLYRLRDKISELKNKYRSEPKSISKAVELLDEVLGSNYQAHTLNWCIYHNEFNIKSGGQISLVCAMILCLPIYWGMDCIDYEIR